MNSSMGLRMVSGGASRLSSRRKDNGLIHLECNQGADETVERLETVLKKHSLLVFARVDHSRAAAEASLKMRPAQALLFGNPVIGTPMMITAPTLAIDLPFKTLVWEGEAGGVWSTFSALDSLKKRHDIPEKFARSSNTLAEQLHEVARPQQPDTDAEHLM